MKKYLFIFKATLIESIQYVLNILLSFLTFFMVLFVFIYLWEYMYADSSNLISGYTLQQTIWYVILTEIMWFGGRTATLTSQITNDIKSGSIAYGINKPYHYVLYVIAKYLGETAIRFVMFLGAGLVIGYVFLGSLPAFHLYQLPLVLVSFIMGILINCFIRMSISVLSFWIEDSVPFHWIYDKLILVVGTMFPVEMFPLWAQPIIKLSPIFVVNYGPAKLIIDFSWNMAFQVLFVQAIYFLITVILLFALYQRGVKKINVNGG